MHDTRVSHILALKRILCYLKGTLTYNLSIRPCFVDRQVSYFDIDWARYPTTRQSTSGFCIYLGDNLVSWSSKR